MYGVNCYNIKTYYLLNSASDDGKIEPPQYEIEYKTYS